MLYSLKRETGHERPKNKSIKKKKKKGYEIIPTPCPPPPPTPWYESTTPHLSIPAPPPLIIHNNNTIDTKFLVQMRQSNKYGSIRNDEIFNLHLGPGVSPWASIPCLLQDTSHNYWSHPPKQLTRKKQRTQKWDFNSQQIVS